MKKKERGEPTYFVPALEKGLDILEALSRAAVPQTQAEISRLCGRSRSELFRMVDALEKRSYIVRDPISGGYELTLKLYQLAHTHSSIDHMLRAAYAPMRDLANTIYESCHLCILDGGQLLVIAAAESPDPVRLSVGIGHTRPPLATTSGQLLVAMLDSASQEAMLANDPEFASSSAARKRVIRTELKKIRGQGFHKQPSNTRTGMDISCLVGTPRIGVIAALGVPFMSGGRNHGKEISLIPTIQEHADRITGALGLEGRSSGA